MPSALGKIRRPNVGKLQTQSTSISFSKSDYLWLQEQSQARVISQSLVIADAIAAYKVAMNDELRRMELEELKKKRDVRSSLATAEHAPDQDGEVEL